MATDPIQAALDKIAFHETEAAKWKLWVNQGDEMMGNPPRFGDVSIQMGEPPTTRAVKRWKEGSFFNKALAAAVRMILEARYQAAGNEPDPASVDYIHEALMQGSFAFGVTGTESQKNSIRISLGKNSTTFVKLPGSDVFGLVEWYGPRPARARPRAANGASAEHALTDADAPSPDQSDQSDTVA